MISALLIGLLSVPTIQLPYNFKPRLYQLPLLQAMDSGIKRAVIVWPRRHGKDKTCLAGVVAKKMMERVGSYYYILPTAKQGRKIIWEGMDKTGFRFLDHFPEQLRAGKPNDTEMRLKYKNGSLMQVISGLDIDSTVGTNPVGLVIAEYPIMSPRVWDFMRPIILENGGWVIFNFTPRGENHGWDIYQLARSSPEWFCSILNARELGVIPADELERERQEIIKIHGNDALFQQEYMCSFKVPIAGAYYAEQILQAYEKKRIGQVPYDPAYPVDTYWDIGHYDSTSIWFTQKVGLTVRLIDFYENQGKGLPHYAEVLQNKKYVYGTYTGPHDLNVTDWVSDKKRLVAASDIGINFQVAPKLGVLEGIDAGRMLFSKIWIDEVKCRNGLNALKSYHKKWDDEKKTFLKEPNHDWSSHAADAFRYMAVSIDTRQGAPAVRKRDAYDDNGSRSFNPNTV